MTRLGMVLVLALAALALVGPARASSHASFGVQDDAWLLYGPGTLEQRLATLDDLGVGTVRFTLRWDMAAPTRPKHPLSPADPAYRWGPFDSVLDGLHAHGIAAVVTLWGAPRWSNGGAAPNHLPRSGFGDFAYAASKRYPWVHRWTVWNEPNGRTFAVPVSPSLYVRRLLNPAYVLLHRANRANVVAGGVTSPRGTPSGMSPTAFMLGMHAAHARLDAYAQNPYPGSPRETPFRDPCSWCHTLSLAHLSSARAEVTRLFGRSKQLWLTEYGYQTSPPDRVLGVSPALQARYVGEAALRVWEAQGVTMLIHFLVRDEPTLGGWQSGFFSAHGAAKPSYRAYAVPLAERSRRGDRVVLWGQVRPGSGRRPYVVQRWTGRRWVRVGGTRRTGAGGTFQAVVHLRPGTRVRVVSTVAPAASPALPLA
jgi:hypothetical protein